MRNPGIHARLVLAALLLLGSTAFSIGFIGVEIFHDFALQRFHGRMDFLARYLSLNSELGILIDEPEMLDRLAQNLLSEKDVARVKIKSSQSGLLADQAKQMPGPLYHIETPVHLQPRRENNLPFESGGISGNRERIGSVRITYSTFGINQTLAEVRRLFFLIAAGLALGCVILFFYISRSIVGPLKQLARTARQAGAGNLHMRVRPDSIPETRELGIAFNEMLDSIQKNRETIENAHMQMLRQQILAEVGKFSMMVAHEVKNPLGIMKSSLDMLKKRVAHADTTEGLIEDIEEEITQLNKLIEDFLNFAQPAVPAFKTVDANRLLLQLVERLESQYEDIDFDVSMPDAPCRIFADPGLCSRAVFNILINAVAANNETGTIMVMSECLEDQWRATIADQGKGLAENETEKIFEPFYSTRSRGSGLGLTFAAQVVKAHNGSIHADNYIRGGAVFTVELPRRQDPDAALGASPTANGESTDEQG